MKPCLSILVVIVLFFSFIVCQTNSFWQFSDIHLDVFYDESASPAHYCRPLALNVSTCSINTNIPAFQNPYGQFGCDTPSLLWNSSLTKMREIQPNPDFVIISGDMAGHCLPNITDIFNTIKKIIDDISDTFPNKNVYVSLGNNDLAYHNELPIGSSKWLTSLDLLFKNTFSYWGEDISSTFLKGGYYSTLIPQQNIRLVTLNTLYYWNKWEPNPSVIQYENRQRNIEYQNTKIIDDPAGQFEWLNNILTSARSNNEKVYLLSHVPPSSSRFFDANFESRYLVKFMEIIMDFQDVISSQFFGHIHRDEMSVMYEDFLSKKKPYGFQLCDSSVTPRDIVNPSFRILEYNTDTSSQDYSSVTNYQQYYYNLSLAYEKKDISAPNWNLEYDFQQTYNTSPLNTANLDQLVTNFKTNNTLLNSFVNYYSAGCPQGISGEFYHPSDAYVCLTQNFFDETIGYCAAKSSSSSSSL